MTQFEKLKTLFHYLWTVGLACYGGMNICETMLAEWVYILPCYLLIMLPVVITGCNLDRYERLLND